MTPLSLSSASFSLVYALFADEKPIEIEKLLRIDFRRTFYKFTTSLHVTRRQPFTQKASIHLRNLK